MVWFRGTRRRHRGGGALVVVEGGAASAVGGRADNQDRYVLDRSWGLVSDGAGGHAGGARAAERALAELDPELRGLDGPAEGERLRELIRRANGAVRRAREDDPATASMAATLTAAVAAHLTPVASRWLVANVGDSP